MTSKGQKFEQYLQLLQVLAFLDTIAWAEGGISYQTLYGGGAFSSFATHPNRRIKAGSYTSTAAGRYQELKSTFDLHSKTLGTNDFSPHTQDLHALAEIEAKGALSKVLAGDLQGSLQALGANGRCAWAALPFAGCNQKRRDYADTLRVYQSALSRYGGNSSTVTLPGTQADPSIYQRAAIAPVDRIDDNSSSVGWMVLGGLLLILILKD